MVVLLSAVAIVAGCNHSTPRFNESPQPLPKDSFTRQWATELTGGADNPVTALYASDQFVFAYRQDGSSSVMNRTTGQLLHVDTPKDGAHRMHPPVVLKDRIVYPTTTYLDVFDFSGRYVPHPTRPSDDQEGPFSQSLNFVIRSDAVGAGKMLYMGADFADSGRAVEVDMGRPYVPAVWTLMTPGASISAAPALLKDAVFVASENGQVAAVQTDTRAPLWSLPNGVFETGGGVTGNLVADSTGLYIASTDTKLYCLGVGNGKLKWQYFAGAALREGPVVTKNLVYQHVPGTGLAALEKGVASGIGEKGFDRKPRWVVENGRQFLAEDDQYVYVRTRDNAVEAVDKANGQVRFKSKRPDLAAFATNTKDGTVFVATAAGRVMAVKPVLQAGSVGELVFAPVPGEPIASAR